MIPNNNTCEVLTFPKGNISNTKVPSGKTCEVLRFPYGISLDNADIAKKAFQWAQREQTEHFPHPEQAIYRNLKTGNNCRLAFFMDPEDPDVALARIFWSPDMLLYHKCINFRELEEECPEIVGDLIENGIYAYRRNHKRLG